MTKTIKISARMTPAQIDAIEPRETRMMCSDEVVANLFLLVNPGGAKKWVYDAAPLPGTTGRIKDSFGRWPVVSLKDAREAATAYNDDRIAGIDPRTARRAAEAEASRAAAQTLGLVFDEWIAHKRRVKEAPAALPGYIDLFNKNVRPFYGKKPIAEFDKAAVRDCIRRVRERGSLGTANNLLVMLCTFLRWCIAEDYFEQHGALSLKKSGTGGEGARALSVSELALCWRAAETLDEIERDALRLLILTGLRKMEVMAAEGSEYADGIWLIPASRMKGKREHPMPLAPKGREIFERRSKDCPGTLFGETIYKTMLPDVAANARDAMEKVGGKAVPHWTLHSIRKGVRTALGSDEMDEMGEVFSENIAEIVIAHSLGSLNRKYNKNRYARQIGRALDAWERLLKQEIAKQTGANVVALTA